MIPFSGIYEKLVITTQKLLPFQAHFMYFSPVLLNPQNGPVGETAQPPY